MHLTILGGGPAGLAAAHYSHKAGIPFLLLEKSMELGGLCRTLSAGPHRYDTGAHRFHDRDPEITADLRALMGSELKSVSRPSRVFFNGSFVAFPPTPLNMLFSAGPTQVWRIGLDFLRARRSRKKIVSFADFAIHSFGRTLAERFLLNYSSKVWGLPSDLLSPAVATRRLTGMTLRSLLAEVFVPRKRASHLDGQFLYPDGGYGRILERVVDTLPPELLKTGSEVTDLEMKDSLIKAVKTSTGEWIEVPDKVVCTLPLTVLVKQLGSYVGEAVGEISRELKFRHVRILFLRLNKERFSENASVYIPDAGFLISRIYEPKNRCETMAPPGETGIVVEIPCFLEEPAGKMTSEELFERAVSELASLRLLDPDEILDWRHHFLPNAYPVYCLDFEKRVSSILKAVSTVKNLELIGRNGLFFYSHLHDQLRFAKELVSRLLQEQQKEVKAVG